MSRVAFVFKPALRKSDSGGVDDVIVKSGRIAVLTFEDEGEAVAYGQLARNVPLMSAKGDFLGDKPAIIDVLTLAEYAEQSGHPELTKQVADRKKLNIKAKAEADKAAAETAAEADRQREQEKRDAEIAERAAQILEERDAKAKADALKQAQKEIDALKTGEN